MRRQQDTTPDGSPSHTTTATLDFLFRLIANDKQIVDTQMTAEFYDLLFVLALSIYWSLFRRQDFYYSCIAYQRSYHDEFIIGHKKPSFSLSLFLLLLCFLFRMFSA